MRKLSRLVGLSTSIAAVVALAAPAGAAVRYDLTNPASTGCTSKGPVQYPNTTRIYGVFSIQLRRSTGCNTVWAQVTRTDTKKCQIGGLNCAQIRITRTLDIGTKTGTAWKKMVHGTKAVLSLQLNGVNGAKYTAKASTLSGRAIGASGTISIDRKGT